MDLNHIGRKQTSNDDIVSTYSVRSFSSTEISVCKHRGSSKELYCYTHSVMICRSCKVSDHRSCITEDVSEAFSKFDAADIDKVLVDIEEIKGKIKAATKDLWNEKTFLQKEKQNTIRLIKEFKAEIQKALDIFEKRTIERLNNNILEYQQMTDADLKNSEQSLNEKQEHLKLLQAAQEVTLKGYLEYKQCKKCVDEENEKLYKLKIKLISVSFTPEAKFSSLVNDEGLLGESKLNFRRDPKVAYDVKGKTETCLGANSIDCNITGTCVMPEGTVLLADRTKKLVQRLLANSKQLKDQIKFPSEPWSICAVNQTEVAVSFPEEQKNIRFIKLGARMRVTRYLRLRHTCRALAFHDDELYVTDQGIYVYVYNMTGHVIRKFSRDGSDDAKLSDFRSLAVNETLLVIADWTEGLLAFDKHGKHLWKYNGHDMKRADGVCFDQCGNILVCGSQSINLLQVDKEGNKIGELATTENGLVYPTALGFDELSSTVVVAQQEANVIFYRVI